LLDRIDLHVEVANVTARDLALPPPSEGSDAVAGRVSRARAIQRERFKDDEIRTNAEAEGELLDRVAQPDSSGLRLLTEAADAMKLTARGYHRVLKVARTIADLAGAERVGRLHIAEALAYRRTGRDQ
jgi:magnesium chelatase family protein